MNEQLELDLSDPDEPYIRVLREHYVEYDGPCAVAAGHSVKLCGCRKPNHGGWMECPAEARRQIAFDRANRLHPLPVTGMGFTGDICDRCYSSQVVRNGTCLLCIACGETSGCS